MPSQRNTLAFAATTAALLGVLGIARAQDPSATPKTATSTAPEVTKLNVRDFEERPPTKLGTKLDPNADWSKEPRPLLYRTSFDATNELGRLATTKSCDFHIKDDWLKVRCKGRTGRVSQVAGDLKDTVVHISNLVARDDNHRIVQDDRRVLIFTRLVPGRVSVFEITMVSDGYNSDWEGGATTLSVDWSDTESGPRILITPQTMSYWR